MEGPKLAPPTYSNFRAYPFMADEGIKLFGFEIKRAKNQPEEKLRSIVPPMDEDGAGYVTAAGAHYGTYVNLGEGDFAKDNAQHIRQYRAIANHPECDAAIEDITNEAIAGDLMESPVALILDKVEGISDALKKQITDEFDGICSMLNIQELGHDIFRRWYIDGRLYYHLVVDEKNLKKGIEEIRPIDALKIRKVKEIKKGKDPATGAPIVERVNEFYIYQEKPITVTGVGGGPTNNGVKIANDAISYTTSGLLDVDRKRVVSYLHKALKPVNQLRMMEDSLVIYRLARAPERRIFYVDVGNLPRAKAEEYMKSIMTRYRNKLVYDADSGQIRDDRKHMSMLEDFWMPRREGGRGTSVETLPGGTNLGEIDDIVYFQKKLYRSLNVPINRLEQEAQFSLGRSTEISRDEVKFQKFIDRLRKRFSQLFLGILQKQLLIKGIITEDDWNQWKNDIVVDFITDNHFAELKDAELLRDKLQSLDQVQQYVGEYFSKEWVMKNILNFDDDDIKQMKDQMKGETDSGDIEDEQDQLPQSGAPNQQPGVNQ